MAGAPNDVSYKINTQMPNISIHCFPKDIAVWPKWTRFDRQNRGDFTLQCRRPYAPKAPVTNTCRWSNQEKITNEFSSTIAFVFAISEETEEQLAVTSR